MPADDDIVDNAHATRYVVEQAILVGVQLLQRMPGGHVCVTHECQVSFGEHDPDQTVGRVDGCGAKQAQHQDQWTIELRNVIGKA